MKWANVLLMAVLTTVIAKDNDLSEQLYSQAMGLLRHQEAFSSTREETDDHVVLSVSVDYDKEEVASQRTILESNLSAEKLRARELLIESSDLGNIEASYTLADFNLYGNYSYPANASLALKYYKRVAELSPNATAYFNLGFIHSTGLFGEVPIDQARAILYFQQAFDQGDIRAAMVLGYRYLNGISVPKDCSTALYYYQVVANNLKEIYDKAPVGGPHFDSFSIRIGDFNGGLYGKGVGEVRSSLTRKKNRFVEYLSAMSTYSEESLFQESYYKVLSFYEGSYLTKRNYKDAFRYAKHMTQQGIKQLNTLSSLDKLYVAEAAAILGKMFLRGEGVTQDYSEALVHLKKSLDIYATGDAYNTLGLIYEFGPDPIKDISKAEELYHRANNTANGLYNYGRFLLKNGDEKKGKAAIEMAAFNYDLSAIYERTNLIDDLQSNSCLEQVHGLKYFSEKFDYVVTSLEWAFMELTHGRSENALIGYAMAGEQGFETAQSSAAYLLYQLTTLLETDPPINTEERREMAIAYLTRSSIQDNLDSTVFLGDVYFANKEYDKAVASYLAAGVRGSSQGNFNMGWLYEQGLGVEKDFYLSKRYYDFALEGHPKAYLPVQLALLRLRFKSFINNITGGNINSINGQGEKRTWEDLISLYKKVRGTSGETTSEVAEQQQQPHEERIEEINHENDIFEVSDFIVIGFFLVCFAIFFGASFLQQRNLRQRRANGEVDPNPRVEFNFRIIAI